MNTRMRFSLHPSSATPILEKTNSRETQLAKVPVDKKAQQAAANKSSSGDVAAFINTAKAVETRRASAGRLIFALDATLSRQPTWDMSCNLQAEMFASIDKDNDLDVQLMYFRGQGECRASRFVSDTKSLGKLMSGLQVRGGTTQIGKVFNHARTAHNKAKVDALVYVGDALEENPDRLAKTAGELGMLGCPIFLFQEGHDRTTEAAFREFARLSKGAYARFDSGAANELAALLKAVGAFARGGRNALKLQKTAPAKALLEQMS